MDGKLSFEDPRVVEVFKWVKELVDAGAYPKNFMTLKLGEVALLLLHEAGRADAADGQLVHRPRLRAGGQGRPAEGLSARHHAVPGDGWRRLQQVQDLAVGASFAINAASKHKDLAAEFLNAMSTPEMGKRWIETIYLQTAVKTDVKSFSGPYAAYFSELMERQKGAKYFIGMPLDIMQGQCKDTFTQVMNSGFPGGLAHGRSGRQDDEPGLLSRVEADDARAQCEDAAPMTPTPQSTVGGCARADPR